MVINPKKWLKRESQEKEDKNWKDKNDMKCIVLVMGDFNIDGRGPEIKIEVLKEKR